MQLLIDSNRGVYIGQQFAQIYGKHIPEEYAEQKAILLHGPDHEDYFEAFEEIIDNVKIKTVDGVELYLHQEDDLWGIPVGESFDDADGF